MTRFIALGFALALAGCSVIVAGAIEDTGDGGGAACSTNDMCDDGDPCNGAETCPSGTCVPGARLNDGTDCSPADMSIARVCNDSVCTDSSCGDGVTNRNTGEACDDGNEVAGDGCEPDSADRPCQPSCVLPARDCERAMFVCAPAVCMNDICARPRIALDNTPCFGAAGTCQAGECCSNAMPEMCCAVDGCEMFER